MRQLLRRWLPNYLDYHLYDSKNREIEHSDETAAEEVVVVAQLDYLNIQRREQYSNDTAAEEVVGWNRLTLSPAIRSAKPSHPCFSAQISFVSNFVHFLQSRLTVVDCKSQQSRVPWEGGKSRCWLFTIQNCTFAQKFQNCTTPEKNNTSACSLLSTQSELLRDVWQILKIDN